MSTGYVRWIKGMIREEFEATGMVAAAAWLGDPELGEHRGEVEEYIRSLTGKLDMTANSPLDDLAGAGETANRLIEDTLRQIREEREARLAVVLERERTSHHVSVSADPASDAAHEARGILYGFSALELSTVRKELTELDLQKSTYLALMGTGYNLPVTFEANLYGPYSAELKADGEAVAKAKKWLRFERPRIVPLPHLEESRDAAVTLLGDTSASEQFLQHLGLFTTSTLVTLATVHWCAERIIPANERVNVQRVQRAIRQTPAFRGKQGQWNFTDEQIEDALRRLVRLGLIAQERLRST